MRSISSRYASVAFLFLLLPVLIFLMAPMPTAAKLEDQTGSPVIVLTLTSTDAYLPAFVAANNAFRRHLEANSSRPIEFYIEPLDLLRFPKELYEREAIQLLARKYRTLDVDVVFALLPEALDFAETQLSSVWPNARIVYSGITLDEIRKRQLRPRTVGVPIVYEIEKSLRLALEVIPGIRRIFVVSGSGPYSAGILESARPFLDSLRDRIELVELVGQPVEEVLDRVTTLVPGDIVLTLLMFRDRNGRPYVPQKVVREVAASSPVPVIGISENFVGDGAAFTIAATFEEYGRRSAQLALGALEGSHNVSNLAHQALDPGCLADWTALKRWNIPVDRLPSDCRILNKPPTLWDTHKTALIAGVAVIVLQSLLIASLVLQRRRRFRAEAEVNRQRTELARASRQRSLGELTAAIAHEINQPLGAILINAEAALLILDRDAPEVEDIRPIVDDIRHENLRASSVISRVRRLLEKGQTERVCLDINGLLRDVTAILSFEANRRSVIVETAFSQDLPPILGDSIQLQTVVLNLAINGMDAMDQTPGSQRILRLETSRPSDAFIEVSVSDSGTGIRNGDAARLFESFFTTKDQGIGIGLSIARSVVESHGGMIGARNNSKGGATFWFRLPVPESGSTRLASSSGFKPVLKAT